MKAKTLMGMIACAGACVSISAFGNTNLAWFDGNVSTTTASAISTPTSAAWTGTEGVTPAAGVIQIDNDSASPLVLTPNSGTEPTLSDGVVTVAATAVLTPTDASALEAITDAKAGFAAGIWDDNGTTKTNYYGYAAGVGTSGEWVKLAADGVAVPDTEGASTTFKLVLDYRAGEKTVKFFVGETLLAKADDSTVTSFSIGSGATAFQNVAAYGSGSITALAGLCEKAVCAVGEKKYGSGADAIKAGGTSATIKDVNAQGQPSETPLAANGLHVWECDVLGIKSDAQIALTNNGIIEDGGTTYIKLANAVEVPEGVSVTFNVKNGSGYVVKESCAADAIKIPLTMGTYTIEPTITATSNE